MTESDKSVATGLILRINGYLLTLTLLLVFALAVLAGWLYAFAEASIGAVIVLAAAGLVLAAAGLITLRTLARLSGLGYCGFWSHGDAARMMYFQGLAVIAASLIAALAIWMA
jgi:hypothetical protein